MTIDPEPVGDPSWPGPVYSYDPVTQEYVATVPGLEVERFPADTETINGRSVRDKLEQRLVDLQTIIDTPGLDLTDNNTSTIRQALRDLQGMIKTLARVDRLQIRQALKLLDSDQ